jgi:hypothetical protein
MENGSRLWAAAAQPKVVLALLRNEIAKEKRSQSGSQHRGWNHTAWFEFPALALWLCDPGQVT